MARSIATIKAEMVAAKNADSTLSGLTSTSATALWNLIFYIVAVAINLHEQIWDIFKKDLETIAAQNVPGTPAWLQARILAFQYSATDPQVIQLVNFIPTYPTINEELKIIKACSIKEQSNRLVKIKVAKSDPLEKLASTELDSLKDYVNEIKFAGVLTDCISQDPDRIMIEADIYFAGQYVEATLKTSIIDAIDSYLLNLPFDGVVSLTKITDAIQNVGGVKDVVLKNVTIRQYSIPLISTDATKMVFDYKTLLRNKETEAGYIIGEDTVGSKFTDKLNMIVA
jgi:hypothetical protein